VQDNASTETSSNTGKKENHPGHRIREIFCVVSRDKDGDEGIPAMEGPNGAACPMVVTRACTLPPLIFAATLAHFTGRLADFKVLRFTVAEEIIPYDSDATETTKPEQTP
jgi:hypothetical protein